MKAGNEDVEIFGGRTGSFEITRGGRFCFPSSTSGGSRKTTKSPVFSTAHDVPGLNPAPFM